MAKHKKNRQWRKLFAAGEGGSGMKDSEGREIPDASEEEDSDWYEDDEELQLSGKDIREILHLQPSDHPGMQLVSDHLTSTNFYQWSRSVKRALGARGKLELLNGVFPEQIPGSKYYKAWLKVDYMISNWIINSISKELVHAFSHLDTTQKLWEALNRRLGKCNGPKVYKLQKEIFTYRQGDQSVLLYFTKLTALWNELDMLLPSVHCCCDAERIYVEREGQQRMLQFLVGLRDEFEQARQQILLIEPLPGLERAYGMIVQVEDQLMLQTSRVESEPRMALQMGRQPVYKPQPTGNNTGYGNRGGNQGNFQRRLTKDERKKLRCTHCQESGHEAHECFKLHGYPDWYKRLKENRGNERINYLEEDGDSRSENGRSYRPEIPFDMAKFIQSEVAKCIGQMNQRDQGNVSGSDVNMVQNASEKLTPFDGNYAFTVVPSMTNQGWIIDSGASSHVCYDMDLLVSSYKLKEPVSVHLPDGTVKMVTYGGDARINKHIYLKDVLLIPGFYSQLNFCGSTHT